MLYSGARLNSFSYVLLFSDLDKHVISDFGSRCVACTGFVKVPAVVKFTVPALVSSDMQGFFVL